MAPDIHTLAGAYVLDAVEPDERADFESHLEVCESCREEVAALREATVALAESTALAPPPGLRRRVLAEAERTPQLPPLPGREPAPPVRRRRVARWLAAAAAVAALAGGGYAIQQALQEEPTIVTASSVFDASDARVKSIPLAGGRFRVGVSRDLGKVAVEEDMQPLANNRVYQLWVVTDAGAASLGVLDDSQVAPIPQQGSLAVTAEPAGGSEQPTSDPIWVLDPDDV